MANEGTPGTGESQAKGQTKAGAKTEKTETTIRRRTEPEGGLSRGWDWPFSSSGLEPFFRGGSPFSMMRRMLEDFDRMFEGITPGRRTERGGRELAPSWSGGFTPAVEVFRRGNELVVRADLPGIDRDSLRAEVIEDSVVLRGERRHEREEEREGVYHSERSYGAFERAVPLPAGADAEHAQARFADGVLEITFPIQEEQTRGKRIEIQEGKGSQAVH